jgi:hypothetical protein
MNTWESACIWRVGTVIVYFFKVLGKVKSYGLAV